MSLIITARVHHDTASMAHSPMQLDSSPASTSASTAMEAASVADDRSGSSSAPGTPEPADQHEQGEEQGSTTTSVATEGNTPEDAVVGGSRGGGGGGAWRKTDLTVSTERTPEGDDRDDHICVCTPAQKVPRPPNSFMLYRSHQHPRVAAEKPGLSNPQISQIIGERWHNESPEVKEKWKNLSIEESKRHRLQYPDYRYKPRRRSKALTGKAEEDPGRCPKCNGRYIVTPRTPAQPPTPSKLKIEVQAGDSPIETSVSSSSLSVQGDRDNTAAGGDAAAALQRRVRAKGGDEPESQSPETKRRRLVDFPAARHPSNVAVPAPASIHHGHHQGQHQYPPTPVTGGAYASVPAHINGPYPPPPEFRAHWATMPPPPRPYAAPRPTAAGLSHRPHATKREDIDESLRLPPLQTALSPAAAVTPRDRDGRMLGNTPTSADPGGYLGGREGVTGSTQQEQIMSIAFTRKLAMLAKLHAPLPRVSLGTGNNNKNRARGPIIALEGPRAGILAQVGQTVGKALRVSEDVNLQTWANDNPGDVPVSGEGSSSTTDSAELKDNIETIFKSVLKWHTMSKEMVNHVQGGGVDVDAVMGEAGDATKSAAAGQTPVALIKDGFSLTMSDIFACSTRSSRPQGVVPAAAEHWEWMANLWRDVVGPDLVVYVKPSSEEEIHRMGSVDFQRQMGVILVRVGINKSLEDATERRIAFEVIEWMRDGWIREQSS